MYKKKNLGTIPSLEEPIREPSILDPLVWNNSSGPVLLGPQ